MKILIIEDNKILRENLCFLLKKFNFLCESVWNWKDWLEKAFSNNYDAIILDVNLPIMNGIEFLKFFRKSGKTTPVIALTSNSLLDDKLTMFDLWVDDYITKPFEIEELVARLKSIFKRNSKEIENSKNIWDVEVNFSKSKVFLKWEYIEFPHKQYLIIEYLTKNFWYPQNKTKIMEYVWGESEENLELNSTTLESHIYSIRKKIHKDFIKTVKWIWYVIE